MTDTPDKNATRFDEDRLLAFALGLEDDAELQAALAVDEELRRRLEALQADLGDVGGGLERLVPAPDDTYADPAARWGELRPFFATAPARRRAALARARAGPRRDPRRRRRRRPRPALGPTRLADGRRQGRRVRGPRSAHPRQKRTPRRRPTVPARWSPTSSSSGPPSSPGPARSATARSTSPWSAGSRASSLTTSTSRSSTSRSPWTLWRSSCWDPSRSAPRSRRRYRPERPRGRSAARARIGRLRRLRLSGCGGRGPPTAGRRRPRPVVALLPGRTNPSRPPASPDRTAATRGGADGHASNDVRRKTSHRQEAYREDAHRLSGAHRRCTSRRARGRVSPRRLRRRDDRGRGARKLPASPAPAWLAEEAAAQAERLGDRAPNGAAFWGYLRDPELGRLTSSGPDDPSHAAYVIVLVGKFDTAHLVRSGPMVVDETGAPSEPVAPEPSRWVLLTYSEMHELQRLRLRPPRLRRRGLSQPSAACALSR